jgi:ATP/maltotriose-dependent transcriptional regulator MalT/DNA-binding SARP family transcriptional activator
VPRHHVARPRLTALLSGARVAAVVAGGGYGKSVLTAEHARALGVATALVRLEPGDDRPELIATRLRRGLLRSGLSDAAAALGRGSSTGEGAVESLLDHLATTAEPLVVVVDECEYAGAAAGALVRLARDLPHPHRLVLAGRTLPGAAETLLDDADVVSIGSAGLAFTAAEAVELVRALGGPELTSPDAGRLVQATGGWAAALVVAADRIARSTEPAAAVDGIAAGPAAFAGLVDEQLARLDAPTADALVQLAHLPPLAVDAVHRVTGVEGLLDRARAGGFPLELRADRRLDLAGPLREVLGARAPVDPGVARRAASVLAAEGEPAEAVRLLLGAGDPDGAAARLADLPASAAGRLDFGELRALVGAIGPAVDRHPRALLHLARACEAAAEARVRTDALERAGRAVADDEVLAREIDAERARDLVRDGRVEEATALAERLLADAGADELQTRVRALHVLGRTLAWRGDADSLAAAEPLLLEAADLYQRLGYATGSAHARLALAYDVYTLGGRFDDAVRSLERALASLPLRSRLRGVVLAFHAEALVDLGRYEEAEASHAEASRIGTEFGDARTVAFTAWVRARVAARRGDGDRVRKLLAEAEAHPGEWLAHHSGVEFLAEAAVLHDEAGHTEESDGYLRRALERAEEAPRYVRLAGGAIAARRGDPAEADRLLAGVAAMPELEVRERWRVSLLRAHAARRAGDDGRAAAFARDAFELAAATGRPELPLVREPVLAAGLLEAAAGAGSAAAASLTPASVPLAVSVLGGLAVTRGSAALDLPPGRPALLVALLGARGGRVTADEAIEALWPGVDPASGRKRLRNVLNRLRSAAGEVVVRDGDVLALPSGTVVDAAAFEREARGALADPAAPEAPGRAAAALARYTGDLLPDARYEDWAAEPRERLRSRALALVDLLSLRAESDGEVDEAIRLLQQAIELDRLDETRYLRVAGLLLRQGRRGRALETLRAAAGAVRSLGLEPSEEHRARVRAARA